MAIITSTQDPLAPQNQTPDGLLTPLPIAQFADNLFGIQRGQNLPQPSLNGQLPSPQFPQSSQSGTTDMRVRLRPMHPDDVYQGILAKLKVTNGMLFPYTPTINFTQSVSYADLQLVHSNSDYAAYTRTPSVSVSINGKFTVQNQAEGQYAVACIHFLRTVSKSYFGEKDQDKAGLPPPVLLLNGYGNYIFNNVPVVLKSHNWSFDDSADGIDITFGSDRARIPALFTLSCELMVVQTPQRMRREFSFDLFASGALMQSSTNPGWI